MKQKEQKFIIRTNETQLYKNHVMQTQCNYVLPKKQL